MDAFSFNGDRITNFEMETSAIYTLSKLLGHVALSMNAIITNRADGTYSEDSKKAVENLIVYVLDKLAD
jgi:uridine phosphorylase